MSKNEGFISLSRGYDQPATNNELVAAQGQRVLLFVHGIFSSIQGAFSELGDPASISTMSKLVKTYGNRVFGYDHWTISKTPLEKLALLAAGNYREIMRRRFVQWNEIAEPGAEVC